MILDDNAWNDYYEAYCMTEASYSKDSASRDATQSTPQQREELTYGREIYQSPAILRRLSSLQQRVRWLVMEFQGEYNVFLEKLFENGNIDKVLVATFAWKETAMEFALKMLLFCTGHLKRRGELLG